MRVIFESKVQVSFASTVVFTTLQSPDYITYNINNIR